MRDKAKASGKPDAIIERILTGQVSKYFGEVCLLEQAYVIDPDQTVEKVVAALGKQLGKELTLARYARYQLGEGIETRQDDFAAEVAKLTS
jgi:elongation factor Ts